MGNKLFLILFCVVLLAAAKSNEPKSHAFRVNVDAIEKQLHDHPGLGQEHRKHPEKYKPGADLSVADQDHVIWFSKNAFHVTKIEKIPDNVAENPFQKSINVMTSTKVGNQWEVDSEAPRTDLVFPQASGHRVPHNYYKISFKHETANSQEIDPHIGVHP